MKPKSNKKLMIIAGGLTVITAVMSVLVAFLIKIIIDCAMNKDIETLKKSIIISVVYIVSYFLINYAREFVVAKYIRDIMEKLKSSVYESIMNRNYRIFFGKSNGEYISVLTNDMTALEENYYKGHFVAVHSSVCFFVAVVSIFIVNWKFAIGVIVISLLFIGLTSFTGMGLNELRMNIQRNMSEFTEKTKDLISGYEMIRSFNAQERMKKEFDMKNTAMEDSKLRFNIRQGITKIINENLVILIVFSIMTMGSWFVITGTLLIGSLIAVVQLLNSIMNPINLLLITINNMNSTKSIRDKIEVLLKEEQNELKEGNKTKLLNKRSFINSIKVKNLSFGYNDDKKVISDLNFEFKKGRKYAIVGESGCGKSTFLKLVQNYYDNFEGKIEIDETDYKDIAEESFFNLFSVTHQNVFIFTGTIRDNITLFNEYDSEIINEAVRLSGLEKLLSSLPEGLDTMINENGNSLSGGEKQRISIARALVKKTPILILDESTSSLDKKTSDEVEKEILGLKEYTCIAVTHKLNDETKVLYDSIIYINDGKIEKVEEITNIGKVV